MADRLIVGKTRQRLLTRPRPGQEKFLVPRSLRGTKPLPMEELRPTVESLINGNLINWQKDPTSEFDNQLQKMNSPFNRLTLTLANTRGKERETAISLITDNLAKFKPGKALVESEEFGQWTTKFTAAIIILCASESVSTSIFRDSRQTSRLRTIVDKHTTATCKTLYSLEASDLALYLRFEEIFHIIINKTLLPNLEELDFSRHKRALNKIGMEPLADRLTELGQKIVIDISRIRKTLEKADLDTWERIKEGWGWDEIKLALSLLPEIDEIHIAGHLACAIGSNLLSGDLRAVGELLSCNEIDKEGVSWLLLFNQSVFTDFRDWYQEHYPELYKYLQQNLEFDGFSVPRYHLPSAAILTLTRAFEALPQNQLEKLVEEVHQLAIADDDRATPWLLTLLVLRNSNIQVKDSFSKMVGEMVALPDHIRQAILDQKPGTVWLTRDGKLRLTPQSTTLTSAFPVYTSLAEPAIKEAPVGPVEFREVKKPEESFVKVGKITDLPFLRQVGQLDTQNLASIIASLDTTHFQTFDKERLLADFSALQSMYQESSLKPRQVVYTANLNKTDPKIRRAKHIGIEGVFQQGDQIFFVLDRHLGCAQVDEVKIPLAISGKLDSAGTLLIDGADESLIGEPIHLFLNNLSLDLAMRWFYDLSRKHWALLEPDLSLITAQERTMKQQLHRIIQAWNAFDRGPLPRIKEGLGDPAIAVGVDVDGSKHPYTVSTRLA